MTTLLLPPSFGVAANGYGDGHDGRQGLMLPVLRAMAEADTITSVDLRQRVAAACRITPDDLSEMLPSGRQTAFANRLHGPTSSCNGHC